MSLRFLPGKKLTLFAAVFLPLLLGLGTWQWLRAGAKADLEANLAYRSSLPPVPMRLGSLQPLEDFSRVRVSGRILARNLLLLDNRTRQGRAGYEVLAAVVSDAGGQAPVQSAGMLVNFGWVAGTGRRSSVPMPELPVHPVVLHGTMVSVPNQAVTALAENAQWPLRIQRINMQQLAQRLDLRLHPQVMVLDAFEPGAQLYNWHPVTLSSATHLGYCLTWFGLALVLLTGWLVASFRQDEEGAAS